jgi:cardiolipin synthase
MLTLHLPALLSLHGVFTAVGLLTYVGVTRALHQRRYPAAAIGWVTFLLLLPYVALPLFLVFGTRKLVRHPPEITAGMRDELLSMPWPQALAESMGLKPAAGYHGLAVHADGTEALAALHAVIDSAAHTLDICTFIIGDDALGREIGAAMIRKAKEGVRVRFLLDGVGRWLGGRPDLAPLIAAGVDVAIFVPLIHSPARGRVNLRNHRKMAIADNRRLWAGGRNLSAEYFTGAPGKEPWYDLTFDFEGELVDAASALFAHDWAFATNRRAGGRTPEAERAAPHPADVADARGQLVPTGPDQAYDTVLSMLVTACFRAQRRVLAATPYFVPDESLLGALELAARRGVAVDIVIPARSNHHLADIARHRSLRDLAHSGARIWLLPQMNHAKGFVIDDALAFVGSANLDSRSLFLNYEMMVAFYTPGDVRRFADWIDARQREAKPYVAHPPGLVRDIAEGMILGFAFQI